MCVCIYIYICIYHRMHLRRPVAQSHSAKTLITRQRFSSGTGTEGSEGTEDTEGTASR